ncbi:MAG: response regulator [Chloroflexi bacterium]|nr:response regulator [Chloroflexota bacterium]
MPDVTIEAFLKLLRDALNHIRDPNFLRESPLTTLLGVSNRPDTPAALRRLLFDAIAALKPESEEPNHSPAWRYYEALFYRYVQHFSQLEVADQLGLSPRQLRRELRAAFEILAHQLWEQFHIEAQLQIEPGEGHSANQGADAHSNAYEDLAWLKEAPPESDTDLSTALPTVLELARPLATQYGVRLQTKVEDDLPRLAANPIAVRQALLSVLGVVIPAAASCQAATIRARHVAREIEIWIGCEKTTENGERSAVAHSAGLDIARQLLDLCGGRLTVGCEEPGEFGALLTFPPLGQILVLIIDDNASALNLFQRYVAGTRYRVIGVQDPAEAVDVARRNGPQIIVLDVMMPRIDGWEVLGRLRQHPTTSKIPVVVCTILAQDELALSLGANAYLKKPVTRQAFLAALDCQMGNLEPVSQ